MMTSWSSDDLPKEKPSSISVMLSKNIAHGIREEYLLRCVRCGLPVVELVNEVLMIVGDSGISVPELEVYGVVSMQGIECKRCKSLFRFFI